MEKWNDMLIFVEAFLNSPTTAILLALPSGESWRASAPLNKAGTQRGYKVSHPNHPLARWVRRSEGNYRLCVDYALALCREFSKRFPGRTLHVEQHAAWLSNNLPSNLPKRSRTAIPIVRKGHAVWKAKSMKTACKAYRKAYIEDKLQMARYRHSSIPSWIQKKLEMMRIS